MKLAVLFLLFTTISYGNPPVEYDVKGDVSFSASVDLPGFDFKGEGGKVIGTVTETSGLIRGKLAVQVKDFDTAGKVPNLFNLRNKHMLAHIESDKYPEAVLEITNYKMNSDAFEGNLEFHGTIRPIKGKIKLDGSKFKASFTIDLTEYNMKQPSNAGATVDKNLPFEVEGVFTKK